MAFFTNPANLLSLSRVGLAPFIMLFLNLEWVNGTFVAGCLYAAAALTDSVDGYLARRLNKVSNLGVFLDLTADKLLVGVVLISLAAAALLPAWMVGVIVAREFVVMGVRSYAAAEGVVIPAQRWGKGKTLVTSVGIPAVIFQANLAAGGWINAVNFGGVLNVLDDLVYPLMLLATLLTVVSGVSYIRDALPLLRDHRKRPTQEQAD